MTCGSLEYYNKSTDRITTKTDSILERTERIFFNVTTSDDPIIRQLSMENRGTVFATDVILAHLMACTRSVAPWDIIVTKVGSKIFFDKRDGSNFGNFVNKFSKFNFSIQIISL
jgi:translation initiation factor 3 subunit D